MLVPYENSDDRSVNFLVKVEFQNDGNLIHHQPDDTTCPTYLSEEGQCIQVVEDRIREFWRVFFKSVHQERKFEKIFYEYLGLGHVKIRKF